MARTGATVLCPFICLASMAFSAGSEPGVTEQTTPFSTRAPPPTAPAPQRTPTVTARQAGSAAAPPTGCGSCPPSLPEGWKHIPRVPSTNVLDPSYHNGQGGPELAHNDSLPKQASPSPPPTPGPSNSQACRTRGPEPPSPPHSVSTPSAAIPISRSPFAGSIHSYPTHIPIPASQSKGNGTAGPNGARTTTAPQQQAYDGDKAEAAAWRWRFTRRWQAEQSRAPDEAQCSVGADTIMEDALEYLHACGGSARTNNHLQIARVSSELGISYGCSLTTLGSGPLTSHTMLANGEVMLGTDGGAGSLRGGSSDADESMAATREVASLNKRAQAVLRQQQDIEAKAQQRWQQATVPGQQWVGNYLDTVEIQESGSFAFLLLKVRDKGGRMKIIVRGRNPPHKCSLLDDVTRQVQKIASMNGVPPEPLQLMGGGVMEWRTDRDRHLHIHSGYVSDPSAFNRQIGVAPVDLLNLTSVLTSQQLPLHYKVTIDGQQI
ncbi:MAG: hypothetical protein WDW38_009967 [Sanguina aurantia]